MTLNLFTVLFFYLLTRDDKKIQDTGVHISINALHIQIVNNSHQFLVADHSV